MSNHASRPSWQDWASVIAAVTALTVEAAIILILGATLVSLLVSL